MTLPSLVICEKRETKLLMILRRCCLIHLLLLITYSFWKLGTSSGRSAFSGRVNMDSDPTFDNQDVSDDDIQPGLCLVYDMVLNETLAELETPSRVPSQRVVNDDLPGCSGGRYTAGSLACSNQNPPEDE